MTDDDSPGQSPFVFLLGLLLFLGSLAAFVADLVTGHDILRSLVGNVAGVVVLVWWAATDTLTDPDSNVSSRNGAAGTGLLLLGLYLVVAAVVVAVTSLVHGRLEIALWGGGLGVALVLVGFLVYPRESVLEQFEDGSDETGDGTTEEPGDEETVSDEAASEKPES